MQGNHTIYFCRCDKADKADKAYEINGHIIFSLKKVFDNFCVRNEAGKQWLRVATGGSNCRTPDKSTLLDAVAVASRMIA
jgi:hypothetical protein